MTQIKIFIGRILYRLGLAKLRLDPPKLTEEGKAAILVSQLQQIGAQLYLSQIELQFLETRSLAGESEYGKAKQIEELKLQQFERRQAWYEEKLNELMTEINRK